MFKEYLKEVEHFVILKEEQIKADISTYHLTRYSADEDDWVSVDEQQLPKLFESILQDTALFSSEDISSIERAKLAIEQRIREKDRVLEEKTEILDEIGDKIVISLERIKEISDSLTKAERSRLTYMSIKQSRLDDDDFKTLETILDELEIDYIYCGSKFRFIPSVRYPEVLVKLKDTDFYQTFISYVQPVVFDPEKFDENVIPLIKKLLKEQI